MFKISLYVLAIAIAAVIGWNIAYPTNSFRYKLTVNVETPEGLKSGFAVREFKVQQQPRLLPEVGPLNYVRGEAVAVDLGERGTLFALIDADDEYLVFNTFPTDKGGLRPEGMRYYEGLQAESVLAPRNYPLLVAFKDANDPKSIALAYRPILERDPKKPGRPLQVTGVEDNMSELFGAGVRLKDIIIEMTREPVTWDIKKTTQWSTIQKSAGGTLSGDVMFNSKPSPERTVTKNDFLRGYKE